MNAVRAEFLKLSRSLSWVVVLLLPTAMVLSGVANTLASGQAPADGWHTMWLRSVVVHGMAPLPLGIAIIASLVWRPERQGGNWNALLSGPTSALRIAVAKTAVIATTAAAMQLVLLGVLTVFGRFVFGLPGLLPGEYLAISLLIIAASIPVAAVQSGLSILLPSFAAPVACALVASGVSVVLLLADVGALIAVLPHALIARTTQLGTGTFADPGTIGFGDVAAILACTVLLTAAAIAGSAALLARREVRGVKALDERLGGGINATRWAMDRADRNDGHRNLMLRTLDRLGLGFTS